MSTRFSGRTLALAAALGSLVLACVAPLPDEHPLHGWWDGLGPVVPHDTFPADCAMCHVGEKWQALSDDFTFDHAAETGVALEGAHAGARCLRCHNDRGPVAAFQAQGCAGCHEDIHLGQLGPSCSECHTETTWDATAQLAQHYHTRFPLIGMHAATACRSCHPGATVGRFVPTDTECLTCHVRDLARANNPNHAALGWTDRCDRCHLPTDWNQAVLDE